MLKAMSKMRAVGAFRYLPFIDPNCLVDVVIEKPQPKENELLIEIKATAINPIDTKIRKTLGDTPRKEPVVLGFDGAGIVQAVGASVESFKTGDEVYFSGSLERNGTNAEFAVVDERIVALKPKSFTFEEAAVLPIATVTAWESLVDRLNITEEDKGKTILMINSAGGVGSMATQIAKNLGLIVIGTASREKSRKWSLDHGATYVIDHKKDLHQQINELGYSSGVDYILCMYDPYTYWDVIPKIIKPQGKICHIVDLSKPVMFNAYKDKSITMIFEMASTRKKYNTPDIGRHKEILNDAADQLDKGLLKGILTKTLSPFNAGTVREGHRLMEEQRMLGKAAFTGYN